VPVVRLPLPFPPRRALPPPSTAPPWKLVVFGFLGANRCLDQTLAALARLADPRFHLHIYGDVADRAALNAAVERLQLAAAVTVHGFVPEVELDRALASAHLALNLRYPTKGEASYSQLRIWSHGLPSLVTRVGWYAELPAGTVSLVRPGFLVDDVCAHLRAYATDPARYQANGQRGRDYFIEHHSPRGYAARIVELAARLPEYRRLWNARRNRARAAEAAFGWLPPEAVDERLPPDILA
jgi:glycosyltransferase involved in cell wall biosynthesis